VLDWWFYLPALAPRFFSFALALLYWIFLRTFSFLTKQHRLEEFLLNIPPSSMIDSVGFSRLHLMGDPKMARKFNDAPSYSVFTSLPIIKVGLTIRWSSFTRGHEDYD